MNAHSKQSASFSLLLTPAKRVRKAILNFLLKYLIPILFVILYIFEVEGAGTFSVAVLCLVVLFSIWRSICAYQTGDSVAISSSGVWAQTRKGVVKEYSFRSYDINSVDRSYRQGLIFYMPDKNIIIQSTDGGDVVDHIDCSHMSRKVFHKLEWALREQKQNYFREQDGFE